MLTLSTYLHTIEHATRRVPYARLLAVLFMTAILAACGTTKPIAQGEYRVVKGDTLTQIARKHGKASHHYDV